MPKKQLTYYEIYQKNKELRRINAKFSIWYLIGIFLFAFSINMDIARIGDYILKKKEAPIVTDVPPQNTGSNVNYSSVTILPDTAYVYRIDITRDDTVANGVCVDEAVAILSVLKRHYTGFDRIKVAITEDHVQVVRENIDGTLEYLKLDGINVVKGKFKSKMELRALISPDDFIELADYYKPDISYDEFKMFIANKYKGQ